MLRFLLFNDKIGMIFWKEPPMPIYFAPMEGLTDDIFRRTHKACFRGVDKYFIPFVAPTQHCVFTPKEKTALLPENNAGLHVVPQVLTKNAEYFLWAANEIALLGYDEVNLNLGCPSPTVVPKGKGAGMLRDLDTLKIFLDEVYQKSPLPVSIKTRIGFDSPDEWPQLLSLYAQYPVSELTIHIRTRSEFYKGETHPDAFAQATKAVAYALCYNGDLFTADACRQVQNAFPHAALMLGRGLMTNPALAQEVAGGEGLSIPQLRTFIEALYAGYAARYDQSIVIGRMRDILKMFALGFENAKKPLKAICKARTLDMQRSAVELLLSDYSLKPTPAFCDT